MEIKGIDPIRAAKVVFLPKHDHSNIIYSLDLVIHNYPDFTEASMITKRFLLQELNPKSNTHQTILGASLVTIEPLLSVIIFV